MTSSRDPWRYVIILAGAGCLLFCPSMTFAHGILMVALTETGLYEEGDIAWLLALTNMMQCLGGPLASVIITRSNCRTALFLAGVSTFLGFSIASSTTNIIVMFLSYGILAGLARGIVLSATAVSISYWFRSDSSIASGLMYVGVGIGMLVHPRVMRAFVDLYDAHNAMMLMGAISFNTCVCGLLMRQSEYERHRKRLEIEKTGRVVSTLRMKIVKSFTEFREAILTNSSFMCFVTGVSLYVMGFFMVITFMPIYFQIHGSTPQESAMAASITGSGSIIARVLVGITSNDPTIGTDILFAGNCGLSGILTLLLPVLVQSATGRYLYAVGVGVYLTCLFVILGPATFEKVGIKHLANAFGFNLLMNGIASLIGPPIAVQLKNVTGSYGAVFLLIGCILLGASFFGFLSEMFKKTDTSSEIKPMSQVEQTITIGDVIKGSQSLDIDEEGNFEKEKDCVLPESIPLAKVQGEIREDLSV